MSSIPIAKKKITWCSKKNNVIWDMVKKTTYQTVLKKIYIWKQDNPEMYSKPKKKDNPEMYTKPKNRIIQKCTLSKKTG